MRHQAGPEANSSDHENQGGRTGLRCPANGEKGQPVPYETVRNMVKRGHIDDVDQGSYYFCKAASCPITYYHPERGEMISKNDLRVRVGFKETEDPIWVCYCFDLSKRMILEETEQNGKPTVSERVRREVEAGNCDCEMKNPSGRCCLGEIRALERVAI